MVYEKQLLEHERQQALEEAIASQQPFYWDAHWVPAWRFVGAWVMHCATHRPDGYLESARRLRQVHYEDTDAGPNDPATRGELEVWDTKKDMMQQQIYNDGGGSGRAGINHDSSSDTNNATTMAQHARHAAAVAAGRKWNLALAELCVFVCVVCVAPTVSVMLCCRLGLGVSFLRLHRLLSLAVALPLLASCATGAAWMFCDQVRWCFLLFVPAHSSVIVRCVCHRVGELAMVSLPPTLVFVFFLPARWSTHDDDFIVCSLCLSSWWTRSK